MAPEMYNLFITVNEASEAKWNEYYFALQHRIKKTYVDDNNKIIIFSSPEN